jgi:Transposase DDE domain
MLPPPTVDGFERDEAYCYRAEDCSGCPPKQSCTTAERRFVYRSMHHDAMQRMAARVAADPWLMKTRRCTVEHPFGTIRQYLGGRIPAAWCAEGGDGNRAGGAGPQSGPGEDAAWPA